MNTEKLFKLSLYTLPISLLIFFINDALMGFILGGLGTTRGFPIPYYRDIWATPHVEFNQPGIIIIDVLIFYIVITLFAYMLKRNKSK